MPGQTEWETEREREEFARAAKLYKPLAGMMAMRFTSGKQQDDTSQVDVKVEESVRYTTVIILNIGTDRSEQTVQTQIRLLLMEQSDQGLFCLLFCLHLLNTILHCKIQLFQL